MPISRTQNIIRKPSRALVDGKVVDPFDRREPNRKPPLHETPAHHRVQQRTQNTEGHFGQLNPIETDRAETAVHGFDGTVVVGKGVQFKGEIWNCERLIISGAAEGSFAASEVIIHEGGTVHASIVAERADIHGTVAGQLIATEHATLSGSSSFGGRLVYGGLSLDPGASLTGDLSKELDPSEQAAVESLSAQHSREE